MRTLTSWSERSRRAKVRLISHACSRFCPTPRSQSDILVINDQTRLRAGLADDGPRGSWPVRSQHDGKSPTSVVEELPQVATTTTERRLLVRMDTVRTADNSKVN